MAENENNRGRRDRDEAPEFADRSGCDQPGVKNR